MLYPIELQALRQNSKCPADLQRTYKQLSKNGRGGEIRTPDPLLPKQLRYQAALHPETG